MPVLPLLAWLASIVLLLVASTKQFASARLGGLTAAVFASTPLIWVQWHSQPASIYPLLFVAGWLAAVVYSDQLRSPLWAALAGGVLGLGTYGSHAATVMMPVYLVLTIALVAPDRVRSRSTLALVGAFAIAVAPLAVSVLRQPDDFRRTFTAYHIYDAYRFNVLQGAKELTSWVSLTARSEMYYDYFNPTLLFLTGRVLLFPLVVLLPTGLYRMLRHEPTPLARLSLAGFFAAPLAAALTAERPVPARIIYITIFAAVVSTYGVRQLLSWRQDARTSLIG